MPGSLESEGMHNSADSLHGVSAAVRRAKQVSAVPDCRCTVFLCVRGRISRSLAWHAVDPNRALRTCTHFASGAAVHHSDSWCTLQELMFFASVGDLKRCTILARTAKQLYGADITDCQDWDARRPL